MRRVADEVLEKRLDGVDDSVGEILYSVENLVEDALDLVDNYRREE